MRMMLLCFMLSFSGIAIADEQGKQAFESRCATCHQLPEPSMLKPKQWQLVLMTMQKRMQQNGLPPLSDEEFAQVLKYLTEQAGR